MSGSPRGRARRGDGRVVRGAATVAAAIVGLGGIAGCSDSAGPEEGAVTVEDLQDLQEEVTALDDRVRALEDGAGTETPAGDVADDPADDPADDEFFGNEEELVGQQATVTAAVSGSITTNAVGSAFRIAGGSGEPVAVLSATPPPNVDQSDVVRVSGAVVRVQEDTFEEDFGIAADALFEDPDAFFADEEGQVAISATRIEVLQEQAD